MKALSLWQPWATLVALGEKRIETRSWSTQHRGLLAIHATKQFPREAQELAQTPPFIYVLNAADYLHVKQLPTGVILAICELVDCVPTDQARGYISKQEKAFGDYSNGRWAWLLSNIVALPEPILCPGHQRLWNWSERILGPNPNMVREVIEQVMAENGGLTCTAYFTEPGNTI